MADVQTKQINDAAIATFHEGSAPVQRIVRVAGFTDEMCAFAVICGKQGKGVIVEQRPGHWPMVGEWIPVKRPWWAIFGWRPRWKLRPLDYSNFQRPRDKKTTT